MHQHPLFIHINNQVPLNEDDFEHFLAQFTTRSFSKKDYLITPGQKVEHQYFVVQGCLRTYLIDASGKEHTMQFAVTGWWVSDYIAYYRNTTSIFYVECLEDCTLLQIGKSQLPHFFDKIPAIERYFRKQLENAFAAFQLRILSSLNMSAEERYAQFISTYPDIEKRVKNYQIASYLGVTPESLSRLRKLRLSKLK